MFDSRVRNAPRQALHDVFVIGLLLMILCGGCNDQPAPSEDVAPNRQPTTRNQPLNPTPVRFTDVTAAAGIRFKHEAGANGHKWYPETIGAGGGFFDYDGDTRLDILLINGRRWPGERQLPEPTMHLFRNQGDGTFVDVTQQSQLDIPIYGMGMTAADYDNDGDQDLVVTGYQQTLLLRNEGNGTFRNMTQQSGLAQGQWSTAAAFVDVDRDGRLDLFIGHYVDWQPSKESKLDCTYGTPHKDYCAVKFFPGQGLRLYHNLGQGRFQDVTTASGVASPHARVLGLAVTDYNQDGWPDLLVANDLTPSLFFANQGDGTFKEIGVPSGFVLDEGGVAFAGMGIDTAYINNDDQLCVAIGNFAGQPTTLHCQDRLDHSARADVFVEQSRRRGIARPTLRMVTFGLFFFDVDLDGWEDLFLANGHVVDEQRLRNIPYAQPPQLFQNDRHGTFVELQPAAGTGLDLSIIGRGAAYGDYDNDGDLDILLTANQSQAYLLRNDTPRSGHFLRVVTVGTQSNRDGIGATLLLTTDAKQMRRLVRTGSSYLSQSERAVTFGLAPTEQVEQLTVNWPSGTVDVFHPSERDSTFIAHEGAARVLAEHTRPPTLAPTEAAPLALKRTAIAHYQAGRLPEALQAFQLLHQQQPTDYIVQQYLIELLWRQGDQQQARALLEQLTQGMPEANFLMQFAFQMEDQSLTALADVIYHAVIRLDDKMAEAHYRLGKNALQGKRYDDAITHFRDALRRHPGLVEAQLGIGLALTQQGQLSQAEQQFRTILNETPDFVEAHVQLGHLYIQTRRLEEAVASFQAALRLQPQAAQAHHNLAAALAAQGRSEEAIEQYRAALRLDDRLLAARNDLGTLYAEQGKLALAIAEFEAARRIAPTSVQAVYNLALAYGAQGHLEAMLNALQETLQLAPQHHDAHFNLGIGLLQLGRLEEAAAHFQTAVKLGPARAEDYYFLALAVSQTGQVDRMRAALQKAIELDPKHARAHAMLAALYLQQQAYDLAWQHGQTAAQLGAPVHDLLEAIRNKQEPTH